jgi:excisionase family DNA binding protein
MNDDGTILNMNAQVEPRPQGERRLLSIEELAAYLDVPIATVRTWRANHTGPRGIRVGRHVRYRPSDVELWLELRADPKPAERR